MALLSLSVVIPTHDTRELTLRCLASFGAGGAAPVELMVVDDASSDGTAGAVRTDFPGVVVLETDGNIGFSRAANLGVERASGEVILVLNSDTEVDDGALAALVGAFSDDESLGIGGAELLDFDGAPQWRAGRWPRPGWLFAPGFGARGDAESTPRATPLRRRRRRQERPRRLGERCGHGRPAGGLAELRTLRRRITASTARISISARRRDGRVGRWR